MFASYTIYAKGTEPDEVEDVEWIPLDKINDFDWAYNHKYWIASIALNLWSAELDDKTYNTLNQIISN